MNEAITTCSSMVSYYYCWSLSCCIISHNSQLTRFAASTPLLLSGVVLAPVSLLCTYLWTRLVTQWLYKNLTTSLNTSNWS